MSGGTGAATRMGWRAIASGARIVGIVDAYDAMTHDRPYRSRLSEEQARDELLRNRGAQFDPELTDLFLAEIDGLSIDATDRVTAFTRGLQPRTEGDPA